MSDYDLIIVGAGPAGSAAALYAHRNGLRTLLVDRAKFPRDKICGDAISGKSVAILHELNLIEQVRKLPGAHIGNIIFGSPDHTEADISLSMYPMHDSLTDQIIPMEGFVIRRTIFDNFLFEQAKSTGATCHEGFKVEDLIFNNKHVVGISGSDQFGNKHSFKAPIVLGCDGYHSVVAQKTGIYSYNSNHTMVAVRQYWRGVSNLSKKIEIHFIEEVHPGYFWIFPIGEGCANVGVGMEHNRLKSHDQSLVQILEKAISSPVFHSRFFDSVPLEKPIGWNLPVGSTKRDSYGHGFLLLGDAAGLIDPFTGEGIGNAFYSARTAIETVVAAHQANDYSREFLRIYEKRLWKVLNDELRISTHLHRLGRRDWWMNFLIRKAEKNRRVRDLLCGMMANAIPRKTVINPLFLVRLILK